MGKVAPKVATSPQGLAELLRRAGVPVAAADLPDARYDGPAAKFASVAAAPTAGRTRGGPYSSAELGPLW